MHPRHEFWAAIGNLPIIVQGALGSALFWLVQKGLAFIAPRVLRLLGHPDIVVDRDRKLQEYVYRRFTSMAGLVNFSQGYLYSMYRGLRGAILGFIFFSVALLIAGASQLTWGICLVGAIVYFASAASWLIPKRSWMVGGHVVNLERILELETDLHGKPSTEVLEWLSTAKKSAADAEAAAHSPAPNDHGGQPASAAAPIGQAPKTATRHKPRKE